MVTREDTTLPACPGAGVSAHHHQCPLSRPHSVFMKYMLTCAITMTHTVTKGEDAFAFMSAAYERMLISEYVIAVMPNGFVHLCCV